MPSCNRELVIDETENDPSSVLGEMAHIIGEKPGAARFDPSMIDDERRSYNNLILLCADCHTLIDDQPNTYTVEKLLKIKEEQENRARDLLKTAVINVTFAQLAVVTDYLVSNKISFLQDNYTIVPPKEKIMKNELSADIEYWIAFGLLQVRQVEKYIESCIDPDFGERLKQGFVTEYNRLKNNEGLRGDELFNSLWAFASMDSNDDNKKAAALTVLVYLFEKCEVFEK
jgi:hypothetical protein